MMLEELVNQPFEARKMYRRNVVPQVVLGESCGRTGVEFLDNGTFFYLKDGERIRHGFSCVAFLFSEQISDVCQFHCHKPLFLPLPAIFFCCFLPYSAACAVSVSSASVSAASVSVSAASAASGSTSTTSAFSRRKSSTFSVSIYSR